jgi:hypothetical protein
VSALRLLQTRMSAAPTAHVGLTNLEHSGQNRFRIAFHSHRAVELLATFLPKLVSEDYALAAWPRLSRDRTADAPDARQDHWSRRRTTGIPVYDVERRKRCAVQISDAAMDELAGTIGTENGARQAQFLALRDDIEKIASDLFAHAPLVDGYVIRIFARHIKR